MPSRCWAAAIVFLALLPLLSCNSKPTAAEQARKYMNAWPSSGMYLPPEKECAVFRSDFAATKEILQESLRHSDRKVRMNGAYVIEKLGPVATSLCADVVKTLATERDDLVRVYLINAARSIGSGDRAALAAVREVFRDSTDTKSRLYAAAAVFVLSEDGADRAAAEDFVCAYLIPYEKTDKALSVADYDDVQWSAVNAVQFMVGAQKPIPLLTERIAALPREHWIHSHRPRALKALQGPAAAAP